MEILPTTRQNYHQAALVLGKAFGDEPVSVAVYKKFSPAKRVQALTVDFSSELLICVHKGYPIQVNQDGKVVAAAVIYPPGSDSLSAIEEWSVLIKSILRNGWYDIRSWLKWLDEVTKNRPDQAHYYLEYLGVEPGFQGKGFGSCILKHLIAKADAQGVGCYLENATPRNLPLYQRFGFQITGEKEIIGIQSWFMWRPPNRT